MRNRVSQGKPSALNNTPFVAPPLGKNGSSIAVRRGVSPRGFRHRKLPMLFIGVAFVAGAGHSLWKWKTGEAKPSQVHGYVFVQQQNVGGLSAFEIGKGETLLPLESYSDTVSIDPQLGLRIQPSEPTSSLPASINARFRVGREATYALLLRIAKRVPRGAIQFAHGNTQMNGVTLDLARGPKDGSIYVSARQDGSDLSKSVAQKERDVSPASVQPKQEYFWVIVTITESQMVAEFPVGTDTKKITFRLKRMPVLNTTAPSPGALVSIRSYGSLVYVGCLLEGDRQALHRIAQGERVSFGLPEFDVPVQTFSKLANI